VNDAVERVAGERQTSEVVQTLNLERTKKEFMEKSVSSLPGCPEVMTVKLEAELGHWYNIVNDALRSSNFLSTVFYCIHHCPVQTFLFQSCADVVVPKQTFYVTKLLMWTPL
jgi:hypothetical protein